MKKIRFVAQAIQLSEGKDGKPAEVSKRVQLLRTGSFKHPSYGKFSITEAHLHSMAKNLSEGARGIDVAIDYNHESEKEAAAWMSKPEVAALDKGGHGLFVDADWTPPAQEKLRNKEFKYLSADFTLSYTDPETSKNFGPTLFGAGLTNRPFVKGMDSVIQLSENPEGEDEMNELEKAQAENKKLTEEKATTEKKLSEAQDQVKTLTEKVATLEKAAQEGEKAKKLAEKKEKFDKMLSEKKVVEAQREAFMADDFAKFTELQQPSPKDTKLSEGDKGGDDKGEKEGDCQDKILALADALVAEKKAPDQSAAVKMVLKDPQHKKLADEYRKMF